jgi:hypothetical protein
MRIITPDTKLASLDYESDRLAVEAMLPRQLQDDYWIGPRAWACQSEQGKTVGEIVHNETLRRLALCGERSLDLIARRLGVPVLSSNPGWMTPSQAVPKPSSYRSWSSPSSSGDRLHKKTDRPPSRLTLSRAMD